MLAHELEPVHILLMLLTLTALTLLSASPPTSVASDQTSDAMIVLRFLDAVRHNSGAGAHAMLSPDAFLGDYMRRKRADLEAAIDFVGPCKLKGLTLSPASTSRSPIDADFYCRYPAPNRSLTFWFDGERISRIAWGDRPVILVGPQGKPR